MSYAFKQKKVSLPKTLLKSIIDVSSRWEELVDALEDHMLASDKKFLNKMERARKQHVAGRTKPLITLKRELGL